MVLTDARRLRTKRAKIEKDRSPSSVTDVYWLYAERKHPESYPRHTERGGKWLLFIKVAEVDGWWKKIKEATESGLLGSGAKVATMKPNDVAKDRTMKIICVYTYDFDDEADVTRVREALRALGVTWKIPYKADADTLAGRYKTNTAARISKRYE